MTDTIAEANAVIHRAVAIINIFSNALIMVQEIAANPDRDPADVLREIRASVQDALQAGARAVQ